MNPLFQYGSNISVTHEDPCLKFTASKLGVQGYPRLQLVFKSDKVLVGGNRIRRALISAKSVESVRK